MIKKIISLTIAIIISIPTIFAAELSASTWEAEQRALDVTAALGLFHPTEGDLTGNSENIKRSEFATVAVQMLGFENPGATESGFNDVVSEHWASGWISAAKNNGLMIGDENGNFMPDASVTYEQVLKVLVYMLGYSVQAEMQGGYPNGYVQVASQLDLTKNLPVKMGMPLTRRETAVAVYNALDAELLHPISFGNTVEYITDEEYTILSEYMGVEKGKGIMTEYGVKTVIKNPLYAKDGYCVIGDNGFMCTDKKFAKHLGYEVEFYARIEDDGSEGELLYAAPTKKNSDFTVELHNIMYNSAQMTLEKFIYVLPNENKAKTATLDADAAYVKNGKYDFNFEISDFSMNNGYAKLVDNDNDSKYDIVFVWDYENYVVESVNSYSVSGMYNRMINFKDYTDSEIEFILTTGETVGLEALETLRKWDVLSVAVSNDNELITVIVSRDGISGYVEERDGDEVTISGEKRYISTGFNEMAQKSGQSYVQIGITGEFYFDVVGNIAAVMEIEDNTSKERYGFLVGMYAASDENMLIGTNEAMVLKIFNDSGVEEYLTTTDKIKDTKTNRRKWASEILSGEDYISANKVVQQLVKYRCNIDGKVVAIGCATKTVGSETLEKPYYDLEKFSLDYETGTQPFIYRRYSGVFGSKNNSFNPNFRVNETSKIFYVPTRDGRAVKEKMKILGLDSFEDYNRDYTGLMFYDSDDTGLCEAIVFSEDLSNSSGFVSEVQSGFLGVSKIINTINEDDEPVLLVKGMTGGREISMETINESSVQLVRGMILTMQTDIEGRLVVDNSNIVYSPNNGNYYYKKIYKGTDPQPEIWSSFGKVYRRNGRYFTVDFGVGLPKPFYLVNDYKIYKMNDGTFENGDENDLIAGVSIIMNNRYDYVREIFIIEE